MAPTTRSQSAKMKKPASNILQPSKVNKRSRPRTRVASRKPTKSKNLNGSQQISRLKPPRGRTYPLKHLENGLVSMETTPDYLVETWGWYSYASNFSADLLRIQKNATDSPLLRLPAEIRNTINISMNIDRMVGNFLIRYVCDTCADFPRPYRHTC